VIDITEKGNFYPRRFSNGFAVLEAPDKKVVIDEKGQTVLELNLESIVSPYLCPPRFGDGLLAVQDKQNEKWGFYSLNGKPTIKSRFIDIKQFDNGYCSVKMSYWMQRPISSQRSSGKFNESARKFLLEEGWGVIDQSGELVVPPIFKRIAPSHIGIRKAYFDYTQNGKNIYGKYLINSKGEVLLRFPPSKQ
jgi:hypothetical protein